MIAKVANTTKEKIQNAFKIKEHALKSTRLNPAGATAHHVLGEWAFGVASISFVERRVAAASDYEAARLPRCAWASVRRTEADAWRGSSQAKDREP